MKLQTKVLNYLKKQGFSYLEQKDFPEIVAWGSLKEQNGRPLQIPTFFQQRKEKAAIVPFVVIGVTCKKPTKKQLEKVKKQLGYKYSQITIAREKNKNIEFDIISMEKLKDGNVGYIG